MPLNLPDDLPKTFPIPKYLILDSQKRGVISLIDKSRLPRNALEEARNIFLYEDGQAGPRPGVDWYGTAPSASEIDGFDYFDYNGAIHLVAVAAGTIYRSTNDGQTWSTCTGATLTSGQTVNMLQSGNYLYLTNGVDEIVRYDGSTTLLTYTSLAAPAAPTVAEVGTLGGTGYTYSYRIARVNTIGSSPVSSVGGVTVQTNLERTDWTTSNYASITTPVAVTDQTRWDIYMSTDATNFYYLASMAAVDGATAVYNDYGTAIPVTSTVASSENTSTGPLVEELANIGSRIYAVRDNTNRYRIWFSGAGADAGAFSSAYDGGYLDWQEGGKFIPVKVVDYRDGKGTPYATVWCKSADGQGCVLQMSIETFTVGEISVALPSAYQLPGSRGTPAPGSVVNVLNDYYFYNSQAFYNLGSRVNFQQLLSTDEVSANIRPTVKQITNSAESGICSTYYDAKIYFSVPYGSSTNNNTAVYDTELKAWLPEAFTLGFDKFLKYTDTSGTQHLLCKKPGDVKLSEISTGILGDYGESFGTSLKTGLYSTSKNRAEFQFVEQAEFEFSNPQGAITVELSGAERSQGFQSNGTVTLEPGTSIYGWDSFLWDTTLWDDTTLVDDPYSESSVWRYFTIQRELRNVQWAITTNSLDASYLLRTLQTWGTETQGGMPRQERIT